MLNKLKPTAYLINKNIMYDLRSSVCAWINLFEPRGSHGAQNDAKLRYFFG